MSGIVLKLRGVWLQVHKWIGLGLAILIIPISVTGSALVWHDGLDALLNPERNVAAAPALPAGAYAQAARRAAAPGERLQSLRMPPGEGAVQATLVQPLQPGQRRPIRTQMWLHPTSAAVIDRAGSNDGVVRVLHVLHGSLMIPGLGRQIVGWIGVFMLASCLTGLWLWWPVTGSVRRGFRWKRQLDFNANLHHQMGFWVLVPLAMLSFTGVWISFPQAFGRFEASAPQAPAGPPRTAQPIADPRLSPDQAVVAAAPAATGALVTIGWPTQARAEWLIGFARDGDIAEVKVTDADGAATPARGPQPETTARTMRRWHDGTGMGFAWQLLIFLGGIIPALLSITGILMWWRSRQWRRRAVRRPVVAAAAAE